MTDPSVLYGLRLRTPRLELRLGTREELLALGRLAQRGIHEPGEMPFAVAWTDRSGEPSFVEDVAAFHGSALASWSPDDWSLRLLVWERGQLAGIQELKAEHYAEHRRVQTGSWLGQAFQNRGIGTQMRTAVLELAFQGLGALHAESGWLEVNEASRRVSRKLGYLQSGTDERAPRGEAVPYHLVALERDAWWAPVPVEIVGLEPCLVLFGLSGASVARR